MPCIRPCFRLVEILATCFFQQISRVGYVILIAQKLVVKSVADISPGWPVGRIQPILASMAGRNLRAFACICVYLLAFSCIYVHLRAFACICLHLRAFTCFYVVLRASDDLSAVVNNHRASVLTFLMVRDPRRNRLRHVTLEIRVTKPAKASEIGIKLIARSSTLKILRTI